MKYFQIEGIINNKLVDDLVEFVNENDEQEITFVLDSAGGKSTLTYFILDFINKNASRIILINAGSYSAAFQLFYSAKCKRQLIFGCIGMIHLEYYKDLCIDVRNKPVFDEDKCLLENLKPRDDDYVKEFMTPAELRKYKAGKDVYFTFRRMKEIFPNAEIIQ